MKSQGRIVLLILFFTGLAGLWWADRSRIPDRAKRLLMEPRVLPELVDTRPDELRKIEILGGDQSLSFERRGTDRWVLTSPIEGGADPALVETLALNLKTLAKSRDAGAIPVSEAASYGLASPARTIKLWGVSTDQPLATLEVGKVVRELRYVRNADGGAIHVVDAKALAAIERPTESWRDRALFHLPSFQVESIETKRPEGEVTLRRDRDRWMISKPWQAPADASSIEAALAGLTSLRVIPGNSGFVSQGVKDFKPYGLDQPIVTITLTGNQAKDRQQIAVGSPVPAEKAVKPSEKADLRYARREGESEVLIIDARPFIDLGSSAASLRSKLVGAIDLQRVDFVSIRLDDEEVTLARSPRGWARLKPRPDEADNESVFNLVKAVAELQASEIISGNALPNGGIENSNRSIKIWQDSVGSRSAGGEPSTPPQLTLKIGRRDVARKSVYVQAGDEPNVLAIPDSFLSKLPRGTLAFRTRQILALGSNTIDRLTLEGGDRRYVVQAPEKPSAKGWRLTIPIDSPADADVLSQLLLELNNLRVESFVTEKPDSLERYGLTKPWRVLTWTLRAEPGSKESTPVEGSLIVGKLAENGRGARYARLGSSDTVFTLAPEQLIALDTEWRNRRVLDLRGDRVRGVRLRWPDVSMSAIAQDDPRLSQRTWAVTGPIQGLALESKRIPELLAVLGTLQAVRFAQLDGPIRQETGLLNPRFVVEAYGEDAERPKILKIGAMSADGYLFATSTEEVNGPVFLLPFSSWESWSRSPTRRLVAPFELPKP